MSTIPLNTRARGGRGDVARTLTVCDLLRGDRDDMVVKAMSWALRELVIWDADAVADYLRRRQPDLAPRVLREVRSKLETGLKAGPRERRRHVPGLSGLPGPERPEHLQADSHDA